MSDNTPADHPIQLDWMAHDLKAPLAKIHLICELIQMSNEPVSHEVLDLVQCIQSICTESDQFISEVLRNTKAPIHFESLVQHSLKRIKALPQSSRIETRVNISKISSYYAPVVQIQSILDNLIWNAILHHEPEQPQPHISVDIFQKSQTIVIQVSDNGPGIAESQLAHIFEPRVHNPDKDGHGVGLHLVKSLAKDLGGWVEVWSVPQEGSQFTVSLPRAVQNAELNQKLQAFFAKKDVLAPNS